MKQKWIILLLILGFTEQLIAQKNNGSFTMEVLSDKIQESKMWIDIFFKDHLMLLEPHGKGLESMGAMKVLVNNSEKVIITLMEAGGQKMGIKTDMQHIQDMAKMSKDMKKQEDMKFKPQNESKKVEGYNCKKYIAETPTESITLWASKEVKYNFNDFAKSFAALGQVGNQRANTMNELLGVEGFPISMEIIDKKEKTKTSVIYKNFKFETPNDKVFSTDGYQIMGY